MKIYTKTGDKGETGLVGGKRVSKFSKRVRAIGEIDELNAVLGLSRVLPHDEFLEKIFARLQDELFDLGADIATPLGETVTVPRIQFEQVAQLEKWIDEINEKVEPLKNFILPGGSSTAAHIHFSRAVCRRAERATAKLHTQEALNEFVLQYLNRLSDLLFMMARYANKTEGIREIKWMPDQGR